MSVPIGSRLGSYEVIAQLGVGGMGEVYRARDTKLNRDVALKVLPASFAADADRVARFKREAQVLASLNHPNIAAIYGIEDNALVMELVEGQDLSELIGAAKATPSTLIPLPDALAIGRQIAEALEAAHEQGIVHRDLKPQNIKVRPDGTVKVLDFGLAKAMDPDGGRGLSRADNGVDGAAKATPYESPTMTSPAMTAMGMILGTAAYMSPEQARGKAVDRRADIWAFGAVLFEMLTGRRVFDPSRASGSPRASSRGEGESVADVLAAVLRQEVDFTALPANVPPAIRRLLTRCLTREPKQRLADASTIRLEIDDALKAPAFAPAQAPPTARTSWSLLVVCGALALTSIVLAAIHFSETPPAPPPEMRLDIATAATQWGDQFEVSPDARSIVFVAPGAKPGTSHLWVRRLDRPDALALAGTEGGRWPFWSPDSQSIGFFAGGAVKRIDVTGGTAYDLGKTEQPFGGAWNADGVILFRSNRGLNRVAATGGPTTMVIAGFSGMAPRFPQFLPDGRHFVYYIYTGGANATGVYLASLDDPKPTKLGEAESTARFIAPNLLLFVDQGKLVARALDLKRRQFIEDPQTVADGIGDVQPGHGAFSVSTAGLVAYRPQPGGRTSRLSWVDRAGTPVGTPFELAGIVHDFEISPDGKRLAVDRNVNENRDIYISDLALNGMTRLTFDAGLDGFPAWSRDNSVIAYEVNRAGDFDIHARASSGAGAEQVWLKQPGHQWPIEFSIDSKLLLYYDSANDGDLMALPLSGNDRTPIPIATTPASETQAVLSPDGRWVAYSTSGLEGGGVVVQAFPVASGQWQVSAGGHSPRWSVKGHELYFVSDVTMMAATVRASATAFASDPPVKLFPVRLVQRNARSAYVVDRQGRFLLNLAHDTTVSTPITALLNWRGGAR